MKKLLLTASIAVLVLASCVTRSTQVKFAKDVGADEKEAGKLAFFYLDGDETITYLTYSASVYASDMAKFKKGDFRILSNRLYEGPGWVALKPGIAYIGIFKAGYTTATMQSLLKGGSYYKLEKGDRSFRIVYDESPNLNAEVLKAQGIR